MKLFNLFRSRKTALSSQRTRRPLAIEVLEGRALPSTFSVLNTNDSGPDSLRQAILDANATVNENGPDVIQFNIADSGPASIALLSSLPAITDALLIDGYSQPGYVDAPLIELNGADAAADNGLQILASDTMIRGLAINRFDGPGIAVVDAAHVTLEGNYIGTDLTGMEALPNAEGVRVSANNVTIKGNLISGNDGNGISLVGASRATIHENTIGVNRDGTAPLANQMNGVWGYLGTADNTITNNLISANAENGIAVIGTTTHGYVIQGNTIGANRAGTEPLGNGATGVLLYQAHDNLIGGPLHGQGNLIAGNGSDGVQIALPSAMNNVVQGNAIGTNFAGDVDLGNAGAGVLIWARQALVGGLNVGEGNAIAYNGSSGVVLALATNVTVRGNNIHDNVGFQINGYPATELQVTQMTSGMETPVTTVEPTTTPTVSDELSRTPVTTETSDSGTAVESPIVTDPYLTFEPYTMPETYQASQIAPVDIYFQTLPFTDEMVG